MPRRLARTPRPRSGRLPAVTPWLVSLLLSATVLSLNAQVVPDEFPGIREVMGEEAFRRIGLDGLDAEQLEALNDWMRGYLSGAAPASALSDRAPRSEPAAPVTVTPAPATVTSTPAAVTPAPETVTPAPETVTPAPVAVPAARATAPAKAATGTATAVPEAEVVDRSSDIGLKRKADKGATQFTARLSGDFKGWDGKTLFRLDNGQIWQQRLSGRYVYRGPANPEVRIKRNFFGFFEMTLIEEDRGVGVTRLR